MLSVVITAWNEEAVLPRAISSVKAIADEIVVVDTESSDNTAAVAKKLGCKVYNHKNTGVVEPVRNFSISKAKGDWIFLLDADEEVPTTLAQEIKDRVSATSSADYYRIPRKNIIFGKWIKSDHWWPDYVYRLFKKGAITWEDTIHSIPVTAGVGSDFPLLEEYCLVHHHYTTISQFISRLDRYTNHQLDTLKLKGYSFSWPDLVSKPSAEFLRQYYSRRGYLDGLHGLALSGLQAFSEFVLYLKAWQTSNFVENQVTPDQLQVSLGSVVKEQRWWYHKVKIDSGNFLNKITHKLARKLEL